MRSTLFYEILLMFPIGYILALSNNDVYGRRYDHYHGKYSDSELMVDVLNNFGLRILMAHNQNNDNNIAFSPYGIGVILMTLGEGLRGEALEEIRKTIYLPFDIHTIRVGLRDIHRHLKSYFIPKEGFLAGITLNSEHVSLNPQYLQILKFYGYDINSFNTALYPVSHITTTESSLHGKEETTMNTNEVIISSTVYPETTTDSDKVEITANSMQITSTRIGTVSESMEETTEGENLTTITQSQIFFLSTADSLLETTLQTEKTTKISLTSEAHADTISREMYTEIIGADGVVTNITRKSESNESEEPTSEIFESTTISTAATTLTGDVAEISVSETAEVTTQHWPNETSITGFSTITELMTQERIPSTELVQPTSNDTASPQSIRSIRSSGEPPNLGSEKKRFDDELPTNSLGDESRLVDNKKTKKTVTNVRKLRNNDWWIEIRNQIKLPKVNQTSHPDDPLGDINDEKRITRSVGKYVITRSYHYHNFRPTKPFASAEHLYFFVNDNNVKTGLDFMLYDVVLPFLYIPNPGAMALAFPLDSDKYYLLLVLPSDTTRMDDLICKIYMHNTFKYILSNLELTHVKVNIPSFSLNGRITLTNSLHKLGIRKIFEPREADFSPLTSAENVYVTNIEQAVSMTIKNNLQIKQDTRHDHRYYSEPIRFNVNRPFLYFVIDSELQIILMTGKVVNPLNIRIK